MLEIHCYWLYHYLAEMNSYILAVFPIQLSCKAEVTKFTNNNATIDSL